MIIIKIENLSKKYIIGHDKAASGLYRYNSIRDSIAHTCRGICRRIRHPLLPNTETIALEEFWALKDINLEIEQGEKVGIIGANGAGKSTLLKILSRITEPTTGKFTIKGRIASLLEVGTGFHPELSGRENIYLNGAILGMTRKEIKKKFDEIVDFSGVEKFLDTPVKRFSSGMYVRLAFAVAAHLEPEILLIDEVLAVGDAEFQKKCLGKMEDVSRQGRTILFVSHNMSAIKSLCSKVILLEKGVQKKFGLSEDIINEYITSGTIASNIKKTLDEEKPIIEHSQFKLYEIYIKAENKDFNEPITLNDKIEFSAKYKKIDVDNEIYLVIVLKDEYGNPVFSSGSNQCKDNKKSGSFEVKTIFPANFFNWGNFSIDLYFIENSIKSIFINKDIISFSIVNEIKKIGSWMGKEPGPIHPQFKWGKEEYALKKIT